MNAIEQFTLTEIQGLVLDRAAAFRDKDVEAVFATQADAIVQFILAPPLKCAGDTAFDRKALEDWFGTFDGMIGYEVHDMEVVTGDEVAYCHSLNHLSGTSPDGERGDMWFRETLCFRKIDGLWKITHEHSSVPFYMDSMKAAVDLKP